ncbi:MAG: alpha/beta fold hydrolase [Planctomycetota bacterium]
MKERVYRFGPQRSLVGIYTEPSPDEMIPEAPLAVILNAGIVHHIGPFRLHVDLARRLADAGFRTLRLDLSGLGDSGLRAGKMDASQRALLDVRDALDFLQQHHGVQRFVVMGLCSGAFNAHQATVADQRIVGAVFMDGIAFRTLGFYFRYFFLRLFRPRVWRNWFRRQWLSNSHNQRAETAGERLAEREFFGTGLKRDRTQKELEQLLQRGVNMLFLYTDGYDDVAGRGQFKEMYGFAPDDRQLQLEYYEKSEHTFRLTQNRQMAVARIASWFRGHYGPPVPLS